MRAILTGILVLLLALWLGWVALIARPQPREYLWTVAPDTALTGPASNSGAANIHGCFGCLDVSGGIL